MAEKPEVDLHSPFASQVGKNVFQRMISEEMSIERTEDAFSRQSKSTNKKHRKKSQSKHDSSTDPEEAFYTPPESPQSSDSEENLEAEEVDGVRSVDFLQQLLTDQSKTKKRSKSKDIEEDGQFLLPLFVCMMSSDNPDTSNLGVSAAVELPSLAEMCLSIVLDSSANLKTTSFPFLKHLKSRSKGIDYTTVSRMLKWAWAAVSQYEKLTAERLKGFDATRMMNAYCSLLSRVLSEIVFYCSDPGIPLYNQNSFASHPPVIPTRVICYTTHWYDMSYQRVLFHLASQLFACICHNLSCPTLTAVLKTAAVVNKILGKSCPNAMRDWSQFAHLWPAYECWSRGWVQLAAELFARAHQNISHANTKILIYGELARMFITTGDRHAASKFLSHISDNYLELAEHCSPLFYKDTTLAQKTPISIHVMEASVWDTGVLDLVTSAKAAALWNRVVSCENVSPLLHLACVESAFSVHSLKPSWFQRVHTPDDRTRSVAIWIEEVETVLRRALTSCSCFGYYLTLLYPMLGKAFDADLAWRDYRHALINNLPNTWFELKSVFNTPTNPWTDIAATMKGRQLWQTPFLPMAWRTRLQWPAYSEDACPHQIKLGDHIAQTLNLRLTPRGHITADIILDFPPSTCLLLDPCTGSLVHDREDQLNHCFLSPISLCTDVGRTEIDPLSPPVSVQLVSFGEISVLYTGCMVPVKGCKNFATQFSTLDWCHDGRKKATLDLLAIAKEHLKRAGRAMNNKGFSLVSFFVFGKHTLALLFSSDEFPKDRAFDVLFFVQINSEAAFSEPHCFAAKKDFTLCTPGITDSLVYPQRWLPHFKLVTVVHQFEPGSFEQIVFDNSGSLVHSVPVDTKNRLPREAPDLTGIKTADSRHRQLSIQCCCGPAICKLDTSLTRVSCEQLDGEVCATLPHVEGSVYYLTALPGILVQLTTFKTLFWDPISFKPLTIHSTTDGDNIQDSIDLLEENRYFRTLSIWAIEEDKEGLWGCSAAVAINTTVLVLQRSTSCEHLTCHLKVKLPGFAYEYCNLGRKGHLLVCSMTDRFREEMYWLDKEGRLLGIIPALGNGPHGFLPLGCEQDGHGVVTEYEDPDMDVALYYTDGHGAICCTKLNS